MQRNKDPDIITTCIFHQMKNIAHIQASIFLIRPTIQTCGKHHTSGDTELNKAPGLRKQAITDIPFLFYPSANDAALKLHRYPRVFLIAHVSLVPNHKSQNPEFKRPPRP